MNAIDLTHEYSALLKHKLGDHLKKVILFGSQARGDAREGSDYDVLVLVDERTPLIRASVLDSSVAMMDKHEVLFAAIIYDEEEWHRAQSFPLIWNISQEGIVI